jgi:alpha/beta hydrolase
LKKLFKLPSFPVIPAANTMTKIRGGYFFGDVNATEGLKNTKLPALVLHGEEDGFVPIEHGREAYELIGSEKEFHSFPGMKHVQAERKYRDQYWDIVSKFLEKYFKK